MRELAQRLFEGERLALPLDASVEEVMAFFKDDRYAVGTLDPELVEAAPGHAVVRMRIEDRHRNAMDRVMGGALFTLADFAIGIAENVGQPPTTSLVGTVEFLGNARGDELVATCEVDHMGRSTCAATCDVRDAQGRLVARLMSTGYRLRG